MDVFLLDNFSMDLLPIAPKNLIKMRLMVMQFSVSFFLLSSTIHC